MRRTPLPLSKTHPALAREWDPANLRRPSEVPARSSERVAWRCRICGHRWLRVVRDRALRGATGCPRCESLGAKFPVLAKEWHSVKNGPLTPFDVKPGSNRSVWWRCQKDPSHEWRTRVIHRALDRSGCRFCGKGRYGRKGAAADTSLGARFPNVAREWHLAKNGDLTPAAVLPGSGRRVWWRCQRGHEWVASIANRTSTRRDSSGAKTRMRKPSGCPYCAGQRPAPETALTATHPAVAADWDYSRNSDTPDDVVAGSHKRRHWRCARCGFRWAAQVKTRALDGTKCANCTVRAPFATESTSLAAKHPEIATEWDAWKNRRLYETPRTLRAHSNIKAWWRCPHCHQSYEQVVYARARGQSCPKCQPSSTSKQEIYLRNELHALFPTNDPPKLPGAVRPDVVFVVEGIPFAIEFDGAYWHGRATDRGRDRRKTARLEASGLCVIRVREMPLRAIGPHDVVVPPKEKIHLVAVAVVRQVFAILDRPVPPKLIAYIKSERLRGASAAVRELELVRRRSGARHSETASHRQRS